MKAGPLLRLLAAGVPCSGEMLGQALGISRAAVWKQVQFLRQQGWVVETLPRQGYRLQPAIELLSATALEPLLAASGLRLIVHEETTSTNADVLNAFAAGQGHALVVLAESQTQGRGRHGRSWYAPYARNFIASLGWRFEMAAAQLAGLSLALGVAVARSLEALQPELAIGLKWPNDLQVDGRKLGGLLVELAGDAAGPCEVVIGLGLNHHLDEADRARIDQAATALSACGVATTRQDLAVRLVLALRDACVQFADSGFASFHADYARYDSLRDRPLQAWRGQEKILGFGRGVDEQGALCIESMGQLWRVHSGEVSVREYTAA